MKIVMICENYLNDSQYQDNMIAEHYIKHNHQVTVITSTIHNIFNAQDDYDNNIGENEQMVNGVKIIRLQFSVNIYNRIRRFDNKKIKNILNFEKPDMIYSHQAIFMLLDCVKYKKLCPYCRLIVDIHSDYINSARNWVSLNILNKIIRRHFIARVLKYIDIVYPITPSTAIFANEVYGIPQNKMKLLPLGVDIELSQKIIAERKGENIKSKLGIPDNSLVIFTGGKLEPAKQTDVLIKAFLRLNDPRLHLIIIGKVQDRCKEYEIMIGELIKDNQNIHHIGWVESLKVYDYMAAADMAVFPASQSVLWQQAIGMGLPLIIGKVFKRDKKTFILDVDYLNVNKNVIVLGKGDEEEMVTELANTVKKLIDNPMLLQLMKEGAIRTAKDFLSYDRIVEETINK
jgi:glycosyltransferase involved in cell wall biosynthesis